MNMMLIKQIIIIPVRSLLYYFIYHSHYDRAQFSDSDIYVNMTSLYFDRQIFNDKLCEPTSCDTCCDDASLYEFYVNTSRYEYFDRQIFSDSDM